MSFSCRWDTKYFPTPCLKPICLKPVQSQFIIHSYRRCFVIKEPVNCICIRQTPGSTSILSNHCQNALLQMLTQIRLLHLFVWLLFAHLWKYRYFYLFPTLTTIQNRHSKWSNVHPFPSEVPNDAHRRPTKCHSSQCSKSVQITTSCF